MMIPQISIAGSAGSSASNLPSAPRPLHAADTPPAQHPQAPAPGHDQVQQAMEAVQRVVTPVARNLQFSIDRDTGKTIVKVVDATTNEIIRQIPGEEVVAIARALDKLQGLFLNRKA